MFPEQMVYDVAKLPDGDWYLYLSVDGGEQYYVARWDHCPTKDELLFAEVVMSNTIRVFSRHMSIPKCDTVIIGRS